MANFFDKKQDVIELKMTSYGQYLYSRGEFSPDSYSFYDSDITYDATYISENTDAEQNAALDRIKGSIRTKVSNRVSEISTSKNAFCEGSRSVYERNFLTSPLGTSDLRREKAPSWNIEGLLGTAHLSSDASYKAYGNKSTQRTPVIAFEPLTRYLTTTIPIDDEGGTTTEKEVEEEGYVALSVIENNTKQKIKGNFEIEVYKSSYVFPTNTISTTEGSSQFTRDALVAAKWFVGDKIQCADFPQDTFIVSIGADTPSTITLSQVATATSASTNIKVRFQTERLHFMSHDLPTSLRSGITEADIEAENPEPKEDNVEYWLDIRVDDEIVERDLDGGILTPIGPRSEDTNIGECD